VFGGSIMSYGLNLISAHRSELLYHCISESIDGDVSGNLLVDYACPGKRLVLGESASDEWSLVYPMENCIILKEVMRYIIKGTRCNT
jgi:hypothetical protein